MTAPGDGEGPFEGWFRPDDADGPAAPAGGQPHGGLTTPRDVPAPALPPELSPRGATTAGGARPRGAAATHAARPGTRRRHPVLKGRGAAAAAMVVLGSVTGYALTDHYLGEVNQIVLGEDADRPEKLDVPAENILVAGVDDRTNLTRKERRRLTLGQDDYGKRSDTMMLLHISDDQKSISAVSFPRDSLVTIPAYTDDDGDRHPKSTNKINAAYAFGGPELTVKTVEKATGVRIDQYVEVDIPGFIRMVDAVGGVEVCTAEPLYDKDSGLDIPAGTTKLNGAQGLAFVRARHLYADQDLGRIRAQQRFIGSMVKTATSSQVLFNPGRLNNVLSTTLASITTTMNKDEILEHAMRIRDYDPSNIRFFTVPIADSNFYVDGVGSSVLWDETESAAMFDKIKRDEPLVKPTTEKVTVAPGSITLQVLNGAGITGLGAAAADDLAELGFAMAGIAGNADVTDQTGTVVRHSPKKAEAAKTVLASLPGSTSEEVPGLGPVIEVVVGSDYTENGVAQVTIESAGKKSTTPPPAEVGRSADEDICAGA